MAEVNNLDFDLQELTRLKSRRNMQGSPPSVYYSETLPDGRSYAVLGNPNLGEVKGMMLAVENTMSRQLPVPKYGSMNCDSPIWMKKVAGLHWAGRY